MKNLWLCGWMLVLSLPGILADSTDDGDDDWDTLAEDNEPRAYDGTGNNIDQPEWGSVGQTQLRSLADPDYADGVSDPPGDDRPTARELLSEVFLAAPSSSSTASTLFVGWGLLVGYDLFLTQGNASEPLDIACNDAAILDVWCPLGALSDPIPFNRSQGGVDDDAGSGARSPINYATAFVDLDWMYGRDEDAARALRTLTGGYLNLTDDELPHLLADGTWLMADQRPARFPVTFALMTLLLREHNRCCDEMAPGWDADADDEDTYQLCRQWTIAVFQHITENDFSVRLVGGSIKVMGAAAYDDYPDDDDDGGRRRRRQRRRRRRLGALENVVRSRYLAQTNGSYDAETNAGADVLFSTVAVPAFFSALPPTVGLLGDGFEIIDEHGVELATASADLPGLVSRAGGIEPIIRGAAYARTQVMDVSFTAQVAVSSPLFNLPVEVVQRGRDHGVPLYNDAREAYGLSRVSSFSEVTPDTTVQQLLADAHGNDLELVDAYTGALAESEDGSGLFAGPLLRAVFLEQLYRAIVGDRHHHSHSTENEDAALSTLTDLILDNSAVSSMPLDTFSAPDLVASANCSSAEANEVTLAEGFKLAWDHSELTDDGGNILITLSARGIEGQGMLGIGFGGQTMSTTPDFVICVVSSETSAVCTDHSGPGDRAEPPLDDEDDTELDVVDVSVDGEWTTVTFARSGDGTDSSDYPLSDDIDLSSETPIIYSWRSGEGIGKHPNSQRGAVQVNFQDGSVTDEECSDAEDYYALHGALLLLAWMVVAPYGIYQARYRKGKKSIIGNLWWEMHQECMVVCAEALLPLAITAIFTTAGPHNSSHARWGFYMIGAIVLQIATGFARVRALEAKSNNFSLFHRVNKHFHIYAGWFAYAAGLVQCYRGLELVGGTDKLIFSAVDISFKLGNFKVVQDILFPVWLGVIPPIFFIMEVRKQFKRYFTKGAASVCGVVELINEEFSDAAIQKEVEDRLMPRTEELPIYDMPEFNDKVLNGRSWVILDGAVLDVSSFAKRHPGGARLIINAMGTDVTAEFLGENAASISNSKLTIDAHPHTDTALEIARSLVVGYIEEEDDHEDDDDDDEGKTYTSETEDSRSGDAHGSERRSRSWLSGSDSEGSGADRRASMSSSARRNSRATPPRTFHLAPPRAFAPRGEETTRLGRLASFSGHAKNSDVSRSRASVQRRNSISVAGGGGGGNAAVGLDDSRSSRATSVDDDRSGAEGRRYSADDGVRRKSFGSSDGSGSESSDNPKRKKFGRRSSSAAAVGASAAAAGKGATVGPAVRLSAEAAAILRAEPSPPAAMKQAEDASTERTSRSMSAPAEQGRKPAAAAAVAAGELPVVAPNVGRTVTAGGTAQGAPVSTVGPTGSEVRPRATSLNDTKPLTFGRPVTTRWMEPPPPDWKADGIKAVGARMIKRLGSQIEFRGGTSGDESDTKQDDRPFKMTRKVQKTRNPLEFFHVCPLLLHEKLCDGNGRPVHRLVFACPGKAAAMVAAMKGVCHFNMRLAQEAGMTVVQRAYNAFAVRVLGEEGDFRVVPALETEDGVLSVEMRIRIYPDGLMSNLLSQLIKNLDNPAVQLQGPFLQDRLTPPPAHRNVVMIAAGTGVNPMIQIIRDYLALGSHNNGLTAVPHSRLVLLWQNSVEADIYCADELTTLQAKANGLLEVTALVSGDITRRNIPGNAFRRAKARLMKKGAEAGLVSRSGAQQGGGSGAGQDSKQHEEAERALSLTQDMPADGLPRLRLMSELSRVSEEDSNCNTNLGTSKHGVGELDAMEPSDDDLDGRRRLQRSEGARGPFLSGGVSLRSEMATENVDSRGDASARVSAAGRKGGQRDDPRKGDVERGGAVRDASGGGGGGGSHKFETPARSGIRLADSLQAAGLDRGRWKKSDRADKRSAGRKGRGKGTASRSRGPGSETVSTDTAASTASDAQQRPKHAAGGKRRGRRVKSRDRSATRGSGPKGDSPLDDSSGGLQHCKLSKEILKGACGEPVMAAVAAANAAAEFDISKNSASRTNDALRELVGTEGVGGKLQIIVSGPAGFVFHVEGLLADLRIPPQVVVTLD